ncbi:MAG TPA: Rrf2 family transcriptional regulator [Abditibacteriaceae bacterium]|jgi:Rrf2 family protein|nr:Rrf2 family transcriptional regulator [Abditibacteriaceae bacterium]
MISQTAEYALRAVVHMASLNGDSDEVYTTQGIAQAAQIPPGYLSKVLQSLARSGLIVSQRGLGGGFRLAKAPEEMTIYEVVSAVNALPRIHSCPLNLKEHADHLCPLHARLDEAMALVETAFRATTIAELAEEPPSSNSSTFIKLEPAKKKSD